MRSDRLGVTLLEVLVALSVLAAVGLAGAAAAAEALAAVDRSRALDERTAAADAFLTNVAMWPHEDLDRRLGTRPQGPWRLTIQRPEAGLYEVVLSDTGSALLHTVLYRPNAASGTVAR